MRRTVGLKAELIFTTAMLVGAALFFGGFLLLHLTEQRLIDQQLKQVHSTVQLVAQAIDLNRQPVTTVEPETIRRLLTGVDLKLLGWELYSRSMRSLGGSLSPSAGRRSVNLAQQARQVSGPQLQIDYPFLWLPFGEQPTGSIEAAAALYDNDQSFAGVLWMQFSLTDVYAQVAENRRLVFFYVLLYGLVLTTFGVVVLNRNVVRPVHRLKEATAAVAGGELETSVEIKGPREIAELSESFNRMIDALRNGREELLRSERMASVGHLSAGMAHEIGNPLAAIIGYLELLKVDIKDSDQRDLVRRSLDEAARIDRLVRDLLDYAAPTGVVADPVNPWTIIDATVKSLQGQPAFDRYTLTVDSPEDLPDICINPHKLTQVLVNLIVNARDASEAGGLITVSASRFKNEVVIAVCDQGKGVDAETRGQMFDPFFSTKPEGEGRGLGLTICHRIVTEAGGRIELISEQRRGSTFLVRLPAIDRMQT